MHRVTTIAVAGACLAGCSALPSFSLDSLKPTPPTIQVRLDSTPPGADARTSLGPGCKTPCSVSVPAPETGFSVTYTLNKFQSATESVQVINNPGDFSTPATTTTDPDPVVAALQPVAPPPKSARKTPHKPKKPIASASATSALPDPSPFPAVPSR
jgi:hypothetical protein